MPAKSTANARRSGDGSTMFDARRLAFRRILWFVGLAAWAALTASLLTFDPADPPGHAVAPLNTATGLSNWMGPVGAFISYHTILMIGSGVWIAVICGGLYLAAVAFRGTVTHVAVRAIGVLLVALAFSGFHALFVPGVSRLPEGGGGLVAIYGVHELSSRFGALGAALWLVLMGIVGLTVAFDDWFSAASRSAMRPVEALAALAPRVRALIGKLRRSAPRRAPRVRVNDVDDDGALRAVSDKLKPRPAAGPDSDDDGPDGGDDEDSAQESPRARKGARSKRAARVEQDEANVDAQDAVDPDDSDDQDDAETPARRGSKSSRKSAASADDDADSSVEDNASADADADEESGDDAEADETDEPRSSDPADYDPDALREKIARLPIRFANVERRSATQEDLEDLRATRSTEEQDKNYVFPSIDLLVDPDAGFEEELEAYVREQATALETALHTYNIKGNVAGIESGPVITLYQVRLAPGTKVSAITAVSSDLARALKSVNIRVVPNTEGLDTVGIEVPNRKKERVRLKELMTRTDATSKMKLPLFLGKDASGRPLITDLASLPHMLIAGTTGSGKSVCMNAIIMGFLYTQKPSDLKLVLVDPKVVELSQFKDIPHLMCPVVTDMSKAAAILEWAVGKMDERYELLAEAGVRDIASYNALTWEEKKERFGPSSEAEEARIPRKLPYMVFVIDELADLMMTNKEVESSIVRIAQKARAVGIHLILATQRPQANVVTGLIKSNMPGRLCFKVASGMDSRIVLDQKGGELLLGQGDMLFITPRSSTGMRAQGTLVDDSEIRGVVRFVRTVSGPSFERQLVQLRSGGDPAGVPEDHEQRMIENAQEDPLFDRAVEIVLETQRGSVSLLQRRLAIGYTRASRLIELMGMAGIIGGHKGSVAREVAMTLEEWQAMKKQAELDAAESAAASPKPKADAAGQPKLFPEPVTAREVIEAKQKLDTAASAAPADTAPPAVAAEEPPFDVDEPASSPATIAEKRPAEPVAAAAEELEEAELDEADDAVDELGDVEEVEEVDEVEEVEEEDAELTASDVSDDAEEEEVGDDEYEYEYVEVDEDEALEGEYEIVEQDEAPPSPEIVVKPVNDAKSKSRE
ncbi:MAG: DNA translocase FtsK [Planctomycetota bacterium]|nr:DNA translocase FtsK [Planctomycetota bacterium]